MKIEVAKTRYHSMTFDYPYKASTVAFCKLLKGSWGWEKFSWDAPYKRWAFSDPKIVQAIMAQYPEVELGEGVRELCANVVLEQEIEATRVNDLEQIKVAEDSDIIIPGFKGTPYPFQKVGVEFMLRSKGRMILGDDPGLGKTMQTIGYLLASGKRRTIAICPASVKYNWEAEIQKWSGLSTIVIDSDTDINSIPADVKVWIINYDILKKHLDILMKVTFDCMVLDEAHYIKSTTAIRSKSVKLLSKKIESILMLTGTPVLNRPVELFNLLSIIDPKTWNNYHAYTKRYCDAKVTRFGLDVSGATHLDELRGRISKYFLRRTKEEVLKELPPKVRMDIPVMLSAEYAAMYAKAYNKFALFLKENKGKKDPEVRKTLMAEKLTQLNALREISTLGKIAAAKELIDTAVASGQKILVFSSFNFPLEELLSYYGDTAVLITGKTGNQERFDIVKEFQTNPEIKIFLGGIKSAGVGITLTAASNVLFLDYSWTPADHIQAENRAHRADELTKSHESINIYSLHARWTVDDLMVKMLSKKRGTVDDILGEDSEGMMGSVSMMLDELESTIYS